MSKGDDMPMTAEIEFTPAQKLGQSTLRRDQLAILHRKWLDGGTPNLTHREVEMLLKTTRALSETEGALWEQIDTLNDELAEAQAGLARSNSSPWPGVVVLAVFLICATAIGIAVIVT